MRLVVRFVLPLAIALAVFAYFLLPLVETLTLRWFVRDLEIRSQLILRSLQDPLVDLVQSKENKKVVRLFDQVTQDERLFAIGFCSFEKKLIVQTKTFPKDFSCDHVDLELDSKSELNHSLHFGIHKVYSDSKVLGYLVVIHDMSFVERRSQDTKRYIFILFVILAIVISAITVVAAYLSQRGLIAGIRSILKGESLLKQSGAMTSPALIPLAKELRLLIKDLEQDRHTRDESQISWNPKTLKGILQHSLVGDEILIVSNREPYIHTKKDGKVSIQFPASGLVTALEPIMRACSGTWIAHGGGNADKETVDENDRVRVPPENPSYQIRRVWLTPEEEEGYYYGFSNEGLWPLCHIAHTRPTFRSKDWDQYYKVNEKFASVVVEEAKTDDPVILVQDYHFALLPKMIRERLPKATIITFWHIPWPNPEAFGICPWREEILEGMLGSSIMGFHTKYHCNNFIETVDRFLEARIDRETSTISYGGKNTAVQNYPISIEWPPSPTKKQTSILECRKKIRQMNEIDEDVYLGVGVDRLDYTKGILERFNAVERFLELHPDWIGKFSFLQIAAPSRSSIDQYQNFDLQVRALAAKINARYGTETYKPIHLRVEHHTQEQVFEYYRGSDVCLVTSLHDGMNLVAKEYIASRDDESGVLILSQFTGAARELPEALIVNPYNSDQCAEALFVALTMPAKEQLDRMRSMRGLISEFNVYRWAGKMLLDAARMRQRERLLRKIRKSKTNL